MKKLLSICAIALLALTAFELTGCKAPALQSGGAYAPTNALGQVIYNDIGLAMADASYKLAYQTVDGVLKFEHDNQAKIYALSPEVELSFKHELDKARPVVLDIDRRWAKARQVYRLNPTPAGLSMIQVVLSEIQRLVPVVQGQLVPVTSLIATPTN